MIEDYYQEYYLKGRNKLIQRLRETQLELALERKNVPMLIFLGKVILGQKDNNVNIQINNSQPIRISEEELFGTVVKGTLGEGSEDK